MPQGATRADVGLVGRRCPEGCQKAALFCADAFPARRGSFGMRRCLAPTPTADARGRSLTRTLRSLRPLALSGDFDSAMRRFESCRPSQRVRSLRINKRMSLKTARYRGISQIWLCLRVRNLAMEAPFLPPISRSDFWCLVFDGALNCSTSGPQNARGSGPFKGFASVSEIWGIPVSDVLTIASSVRLVQQSNSVITREVEATHRLRCGIIVTSDDCIAIETDEVFVLRVHRRSAFLHARSAYARDGA